MKERVEKNPGSRYKICSVKCYGNALPLQEVLHLGQGWGNCKQAFWKDLRAGAYLGGYDTEPASPGSIALFGVLKVMDEVAFPLHKTVIVVYTEDDPEGADPHDLLENAVRIKTTSVLVQVMEADPDWQEATETGEAGVTPSSDSDEDDDGD